VGWSAAAVAPPNESGILTLEDWQRSTLRPAARACGQAGFGITIQRRRTTIRTIERISFKWDLDDP
jgi:hypothetical protein